jgi:hypothetical protein
MLIARDSANYTKTKTDIAFPTADIMMQSLLLVICIGIIGMLYIFRPVNIIHNYRMLNACIENLNNNGNDTSVNKICNDTVDKVNSSTKMSFDSKVLASLTIFVSLSMLTAKVYTSYNTESYEFIN